MQACTPIVMDFKVVESGVYRSPLFILMGRDLLLYASMRLNDHTPEAR